MSSAARGPLFLGTKVAITAACVLSCGGSNKVEPVKSNVYVEPGQVAPSPNGIEFPKEYRDWSVLSVAHRVDKQTLRVVVGNDVAIEAARARNTNPWPDGTIIGNIVWEQMPDTNWPNNITVDEFVRAEFMVKDVQSFANNDSGWGWARWNGASLTPYGDDEDFFAECIDCHKKVSGTDWVFTNPVLLP
jgi:hypothetical protein